MRLRILGAIIAGGRSQRFGSDKAEAIYAGRTLLDHVMRSLSDQTDALVVCGRQIPGWICLSDRPAPGLGPLGGLAAALHVARTRGFDGVITSACDTPIIPVDLAECLVGPDPAIVAGQPLFGFWPARLSKVLDEFLTNSSSRSVREWAVHVGARHACVTNEIPNINTVADLAALQSAGSTLA